MSNNLDNIPELTIQIGLDHESIIFVEKEDPAQDVGELYRSEYPEADIEMAQVMMEAVNNLHKEPDTLVSEKFVITNHQGLFRHLNKREFTNNLDRAQIFSTKSSTEAAITAMGKYAGSDNNPTVYKVLKITMTLDLNQNGEDDEDESL